MVKGLKPDQIVQYRFKFSTRAYAQRACVLNLPDRWHATITTRILSRVRTLTVKRSFLFPLEEVNHA